MNLHRKVRTIPLTDCIQVIDLHIQPSGKINTQRIDPGAILNADRTFFSNGFQRYAFMRIKNNKTAFHRPPLVH